MAAPELSLQAVLVLVDASAVAAQSRDLAAGRHAGAAGEIGQTSWCSTRPTSPAMRHWRPPRLWLDATVPSTPRIATTQSELPLALASGLHGQAGPHAPCDVPGCDHRSRPCAPRRPWRAVRDLEARGPRPCSRPRPCAPGCARCRPGVLRFKGLLKIEAGGGGETRSEVQYAGRRGMLRRATARRSMPKVPQWSRSVCAASCRCGRSRPSSGPRPLQRIRPALSRRFVLQCGLFARRAPAPLHTP